METAEPQVISEIIDEIGVAIEQTNDDPLIPWQNSNLNVNCQPPIEFQEIAADLIELKDDEEVVEETQDDGKDEASDKAKDTADDQAKDTADDQARDTPDGQPNDESNDEAKNEEKEEGDEHANKEKLDDMMEEIVEEKEKEKPEETDEKMEDAAEEYIVEKIMDKKIDEKGFVKYFVKWEGYPPSANTWEPLENLAACDKALQNYELKQAQRISSGKGKGKRQEHDVNDIIGITVVDSEKFFLVSLLNSSKSTFIRTSLANKLFPDKVIDFYLKHLQWKQKSD